MPADWATVGLYAVCHLCCVTVAYELCDFPKPAANVGRFMTECSMAYLGSTIYCDPDAVLSRTEAELLRHYLRCNGKMSGCFCHRQQMIAEKCTEIKIAILLLRYDSMPDVAARNKTCIRSLTDRFDRDLLNNSFKFPFSVWKTWVKHACCYIDLFITLVLGSAFNSTLSPAEGYFLPFVTPKFIRKYPLMETDPIISALSSARKTVWFSHLINYTSRLCAVVLEQQSAQLQVEQRTTSPTASTRPLLLPVPPWMTMIFFCAILAVPLTICVEKLLSATRRCHPRPFSEPTPTRMKHRWRAGFAGGMLAENMRHKRESKVIAMKSARQAVSHPQTTISPFSLPVL